VFFFIFFGKTRFRKLSVREVYQKEATLAAAVHQYFDNVRQDKKMKIIST
jgi:hypothetical protein